MMEQQGGCKKELLVGCTMWFLAVCTRAQLQGRYTTVQEHRRKAQQGRQRCKRPQVDCRLARERYKKERCRTVQGQERYKTEHYKMVQVPERCKKERYKTVQRQGQGHCKLAQLLVRCRKAQLLVGCRVALQKTDSWNQSCLKKVEI